MSLSFGSMSIVGLFLQGLKFWLSRLTVLVPVYLIILLPWFIGTLILPLVIFRPGVRFRDQMLAGSGVQFVSQVFVFLGLAASLFVVTQATVGRGATVAQAFQYMLSRWFRLLSTAVLLTIVLYAPLLAGLPGLMMNPETDSTGRTLFFMGGAVGLFVSLLLTVLLLPTPQVVMVDGFGPPRALLRAMALMKGQFLRGLAVVLLMGVQVFLFRLGPVMLALVMPSTQSEVLPGQFMPVIELTSYVSHIVATLAQYVADVLGFSLTSVVWTLFFLDTQTRRVPGFSVAAVAQRQLT